MKRLLALLWLASATLATADAPRIGRNSLIRLESRVDSFLVRGDEPCQLLGDTRGLYLEGYGAVFTSMAALVATPMPTPFSDFTQKDVEKVHARKLKQLPVMKEKMRTMLLMMAADPALDSVRPNEQIVYGVSFFYFKQWENMTGLPQQIVMQGEKQKLMDVQSGRIPRTQLETILKVQEL
jgi:hypothetical protein